MKDYDIDIAKKYETENNNNESNRRPSKDSNRHTN